LADKGAGRAAAPPFEGFYQRPQLKRWLDALPRRFSCRAFSAPADLSQYSALEYAAGRAALPGVRLALSPRGARELVVSVPLFPRFEGLQAFAAILVKPGLKWGRLCAGMSGEALALEMAAMGLSGCFMTGNYRRDLARSLVKEGEEIAAVIPFGVPKDPEGARGRKRKPLAAFCADDPAKWPHWAYKAAEAMRSAPSAMNRQPWRLGFSGSTLSFSGNKPDSVDSGIALLHLECAAGGLPHAWSLARDGKTFLLRTEETDEPV